MQSQKDIVILNQGGIFRKTLSQNGIDSSIIITYLRPFKSEEKRLDIDLASIETLAETIARLLVQREQFIAENNPHILSAVNELRAFNTNLSQTFPEIHFQFITSKFQIIKL